LVEGYMDVVALSQFGVEGVAATLGTAPTPEQARLLQRFAPEVHLAYDGDRAGQKAILRGLEVLEGANVPVRVLDLPGGLDPDEYIRQEGLDAFLSLKPISGVQYRMRREKEQHDMSTEEGRIEYAKACAAYLRSVKEPVELDNHIKHLSIETGISREVLMQQVGLQPVAAKTPAPNRVSFRKQAETVSKVDWAAQTLLAVLATGRLPRDIVSPDEFEDPVFRSFCESLLSGESAAALMEKQVDDQGRTAVGEILSIDTNVDDDALRKMAQESRLKLKRARLEREMDAVQKMLPTLPLEQQQQETMRLIELNEQLNRLK